MFRILYDIIYFVDLTERFQVSVVPEICVNTTEKVIRKMDEILFSSALSGPEVELP